MPAHLFYKLHPFHLLISEDMTLLQVGPAIERTVPGVKVGDHFITHFKVGGGLNGAFENRLKGFPWVDEVFAGLIWPRRG